MLIFLLIPIFSFAQKDKLENILFRLQPDTNAKQVILPKVRGIDFYKQYEVGIKSVHDYIVSDDSTYFRIFSRYPKDSLPMFDFTKQELLVNLFCLQCLTFCSHDGWDYQPCHCNACRYSYVWYVRNKNQ